MSVVNTMLRDLEARSGEQRKPRIPVRNAASPRRSNVLLVAVAAAAVAAVAWQYLMPVDAPKKAAAPTALTNVPPVVQSTAATPAVAASESIAAPAIGAQAAPAASPSMAEAQTAAAPPLQANWQWSNDGFALQLDNASGVRYGVERVAAGTLKISLTHATLPLLDIPAPTPSWIDSTRIQRDAGQQTVTVVAGDRLEYDVAMLDDGALVISVWRDAKDSAAGLPEQPVSIETVTETVRPAEPMATQRSESPNSEMARAMPREYAQPRIDRSALTPAQRDARQAAQASTQLRAGQPSQALSTLRSAVQSGEAAPKSAALLVTILMSQQKLREAQPYLDSALQQSPQDPALLKLKARMLASQGDIARARDVIAPLASTMSADVELLALMASLAQQAQDFTAAAAYYLQWTRTEPTSGAAWYGLALALDAQASSASAVAAYRHALPLINDARLREYASSRIAALQATSTESVTTGAAVAR